MLTCITQQNKIQTGESAMWLKQILSIYMNNQTTHNKKLIFYFISSVIIVMTKLKLLKSNGGVI